MQVKKIDVFPLGYEEPNDDNAMRYVVLVRIEASDGTVGWGECISQFLESTLATAALVESGLVPLIVGQDPYDIETLWEAMRRRVWWYGDVGGIAAFGISAIDMALWDLKGKLLGLPLYQLLGGKQQDRLPACASSHPRSHTIDAMAEELAGSIATGYQLVKVGFGKKGLANLGVDEARDAEFVRAVRQAIGPTAGFIVDIGANVRWDIARAVRTARACAEARVTWLEDVFPLTNMEGYKVVRQAVPE